MTPQEAKLLVHLTSLPTVAGREDAVIHFIAQWAKRRKWVQLAVDDYGNLTLRDAKQAKRRTKTPPLVVTAHLDHPAFVCESVEGGEAVLRFRGGVAEEFFVGSAVRHWFGESVSKRGERGVVVQYEKDDAAAGVGPGPRVVVLFAKPVDAHRCPPEPGDVFTWDLPAAKIARGTLTAPACDNLAGVAAALCAFERMHRQRPSKAKRRASPPELRLLFTRAEEVGFIGALAVCQDGLLPDDAWVVVLEASKALSHAPIGGGPIVRVGDRVSVFDPSLTASLTHACVGLARETPDFLWQRKLMDGGACEATAYTTYGYPASCLCVPLGQYHNMHERRKRIASESIATADWAGMVSVLAALPEALAASEDPAEILQTRMEERFAHQAHLLEPADVADS